MAPMGWGPGQMVHVWLSEEDKFHSGVFPDISTGDWSECSHFTQIIWPDTTEVGCGEAEGEGSEWLVCRYSPGGNKGGQPVGEVQLVEQSVNCRGEPIEIPRQKMP